MGGPGCGPSGQPPCPKGFFKDTDQYRICSKCQPSCPLVQGPHSCRSFILAGDGVAGQIRNGSDPSPPSESTTSGVGPIQKRDERIDGRREAVDPEVVV